MTVPIDGWSYHHAAFGPDGGTLAVSQGFKPRVITLFSFPAMEVTNSVSIPSLGMGLCPLSVSPCGRILAVVGDVAAVLNAATLELIEEIPMKYGSDVAFLSTAPLMAVGSSSAGEVFDTTRFLKAIEC